MNKSRRCSQSLKETPQKNLGVKELVFLRDIRYGFLPDNHEIEYEKCLTKISLDPGFASKCLQLALSSRNEDVVKVLLNALQTDKNSFARHNFLFVEPILLEATQSEDLESIRSVLEWRDLTAVKVGFSRLEQKLLKMNMESQEVIITAAILDNFEIVKMLYQSGYRIYYESGESAYQVDYKLKFSKENINSSADFVAHHIDRVRKFKALSSPAYIALSCKTDPISHCFDFCISAGIRMKKEPEFRRDYEDVLSRCKSFAVAVLDSCRNSREVEASLLSNKQLRRALDEGQKEFVAHPYSQLLLYTKWTKDLHWASYTFWMKLQHVLLLLVLSPFLCIMYIFSPYRDHSETKGFLRILRHLDRPINRYILSIASYCLFLFFLLFSVLKGIGDHGNQLKEFLSSTWKSDRTWYFNITTYWIICYTLRDVKDLIKYTLKRKKPLGISLLIYNLIMEGIFIIAIGLKYYGYSEIAKTRRRLSLLILEGKLERPKYSVSLVPTLVVGANLYGVGASLAFLKLIFLFDIHRKFGPILFCIRHVIWDILTVVISYFISMIAFAVGLVSIFGVYSDESVEHFSDFMSAFKTLFWIIFDPGKEEYADIIEDAFFNTTISKGKAQSQVLSHKIGLFVWGVYQVFVVLIMMNLLVSLMTTTFAHIQKNSDVEWKFSRGAIWLKYFNDQCSIPAPFNLFPSVHSVQLVVKWIRAKTHRARMNDLQQPNAFNILLDKTKERSIFHPILERVFSTRSMDGLKVNKIINKADLGALEKEIEIDVSELRRDVRHLREELVSLVKGGKKDSHVPMRKRKAIQRRRHSLTSLSKKLPINVQLPKVLEEPKSKSQSRRDEKLMEHLIQTLGLSTPYCTRRLRDGIRSQEFPDPHHDFV